MDFILEMREAFQLFDKVSFGAKAFQQKDNQHNGILRNEFQWKNILYNNIECSDIQQNDFQQNDIQQNDFQHNEFQHNDIHQNYINHNNIKKMSLFIILFIRIILSKTL